MDILKILLLVFRELSNPEGLAEDQRDQMYCLLIEHAKRLVQINMEGSLFMANIFSLVN